MSGSSPFDFAQGQDDGKKNYESFPFDFAQGQVTTKNK
ncbi:hypothetical protein HDF08_001338 [Edaphobacter lichenicola]|uniref:Uncharacterized protein n=1 Tax=Tunturiibacter lichenicola TaxID=2051959 RepID=A0A852VDB6_9BACT|nr:hypothetical protein [Edaphobacter lichenicola]